MPKSCGDEKIMDALCEQCRWFVFDEEDSDGGYCNLTLDEDEYVRFLAESSCKTCKYFCADGGEYEIVRRQN